MQYHSKYDKMYDDAVCAGAVLRLHSECTTWLFEFTALNNSPLQIDGKNQFVHSIFYICFIPYFAIPGESNYQTNIDISIARPKFVQIHPNLNQLAHKFKSIFGTISNQHIIPNLLFNWFYANQNSFKQTNSCTNWE